MVIIECLYGILFIILSVIVIRSDIKFGYIRNNVLLLFLSMSVILGVIYYGAFAREFLFAFLANVGIILCASLLLFYTHSFAGGDSKLAVVFAFCYPGAFYLSYGNTSYTLIGAIGLAIIGGYVYLLGYSLIKLIRNRTKWNSSYIKNFVFRFIWSYVVAMIYISLVNVVANMCYANGIDVNVWIIRIACMALAWIVGKHSVLYKWQILIPVLLLDIIGSIYIDRMPFSVNPADYVIVVIVLLCRMTITPSIYEDIRIEQLNEGMILSFSSSMLMQNSKIKGLPALSTEDLRSRLTSEEVESIQNWSENSGITEVAIVKKIPFAVFLVAGYLIYFLIWCMV